MSDLTDNYQQEVRDYLEKQVRSGFADLETLAHDTGEIFADNAAPAAIEAFAKASLQDILVDYKSEQRNWPSETDCDRLDAALAELETKGIISRQNFWCCGTCGLEAIGEEIDRSRASGRHVRGYTFYHEQDTESAIEGHELNLYYGAIDDIEAHSLEIAREIQEVLQRHGLTTEWDGTLATRVGVTLDWKRRQP